MCMRHLPKLFLKCSRMQEMIMKTLPLKVDVSEDGSKTTVHYAAFPYHCFNSSGIISLWSLLKTMESGRHHSRIMYTALKDGNDYPKNGMVFVVTQSFQFNWERLICATREQTFPYTVSCDLQTIGKTWCQLKQTMTNSLDGVWLVKGTIKLVVVDPETRRPKEFPRLFKEQYSDFAGVSSPRINTPDIPSLTFSLPFSVGYCDLDGNKHLNEAYLVKHAFNCVWKANQTNLFLHFGKDIGKQPLRNVTILYKGEGIEGEQLVSLCWQDSTNPHFIHTVIKHKDKVLAYLKMTFDLQKESKL